MAQGFCELLWLKIILEDLKIKWDDLIRLYYDNKFAISITHNPVQHGWTKHIEINKHFIKEELGSGLIYTFYKSIYRYNHQRFKQYNVSSKCIQPRNGKHLFTNLKGFGKMQLVKIIVYNFVIKEKIRTIL